LLIVLPDCRRELTEFEQAAAVSATQKGVGCCNSLRLFHFVVSRIAAGAVKVMGEEVKEVTLEALTERIGRLEEQVKTQITPRFDDVQDENKALFGRIDLYFADLQKQINSVRADLEKELRKEHTVLSDDVNKLLAESRLLLEEMRQQFAEKVRERIQAVTSDEIAEALTKKILVVRNATRDELNNPDVLKVRQATLDEIHNRQM